MKKLLIALLAVMMILPAAPVSSLAETAGETITSGDLDYILLMDGTAKIMGYSGSAEELEIPVELDGHAVAAVGKYAFRGCGSLRSVTVPDGVTDIGANPFFECDSLKEIVVSANHPSLATADGALISRPDGRLICYPCALKAETYEIPQGTRIIGDGAFADCESLKSVTIPEGVTVIEGSAFRRCAGLTSVTIPGSVTAIRGSAFSGCDRLTSVAIPDSVTEIGSNPFRYCEALREIIVSADHPRMAVVDGALIDRSDGRLICYPCALKAETYGIPQETRIIGDYAFANCDRLKSVTIPEGVTGISDWAFAYCERLESVTIPGSVTAIGKEAFYYCDRLSSAAIPDGVTDIGRSAFEGCESLASVTIPDSVPFIRYATFQYCRSLTTVTIPDSVTIIGERAFGGCGGLASVTIPDSVTAIRAGAFSHCYSLESLEIPDSVTEIGEGAFDECPDLTLTVGRGSYAEEYCVNNGLDHTLRDNGV